MQRQSTARVLLVANEFSSSHGLREVARRAGLSLNLEQVASRDEFFASVSKSTPALILINLTGIASLPATEVVHHAQALHPAVPVVVLGNDSPNEPAAQSILAQGAAEYVLCSELERLPILVDRVLRSTGHALMSDRLQRESERSAQVLRENQKMITIGRLAASIAHEINNPLESITNLLYLLNAEPDMPPTASSYLTLAQRELDRVVQISKQTLTFSRETPTSVRIQPADLLEEVLVLYARKIEEKQLKIVREYDSPERVSVFPGEMRQVFSNIITNAIEASSHHGRLRLRIRKARQWSDGRILGLRVSVGDTGSGIPDRVRQRLGEPFFTTKGQRGTGLGLWVTQSIVQRYGGNIQLYSSTRAVRHGTVFSVFLPTNLRPQAVPLQGGSSPRLSRGPGGSSAVSRAVEQGMGRDPRVGREWPPASGE